MDGVLRQARLARHFAEASVMNRSLAEKAVHYAELAAQQAVTAAAWDEAAEWYRGAIGGLDGSDPAHEGDLLVALSVCSRNAAGLMMSDSHTAFIRAVEAYRRGSAPRSFAAGVVRGLASVVMGADRQPY